MMEGIKQESNINHENKDGNEFLKGLITLFIKVPLKSFEYCQSMNPPLHLLNIYWSSIALPSVESDIIVEKTPILVTGFPITSLLGEIPLLISSEMEVLGLLVPELLKTDCVVLYASVALFP